MGDRATGNSGLPSDTLTHPLAHAPPSGIVAVQPQSGALVEQQDSKGATPSAAAGVSHISDIAAEKVRTLDFLFSIRQMVT